MTNESSLLHLKEAWTNQVSSGLTLSREAMEERTKMHEQKLRKDHMSFWIGQICIAAAGVLAVNMRPYAWSEVIRVSCMALWVILYNTGYAQRVRADRSKVSLGLNPSDHSLADSYRDFLSRRRDFYRHSSFLVVPCLVVVVFALPALAASIEGRVSGLVLIPYGILVMLSYALYALRRRTELPGINREIRELDEYRKWNPAG